MAKLRDCTNLIKPYDEIRAAKFDAYRLVLDTGLSYDNAEIWNAKGLEESGACLIFGADTVAYRYGGKPSIYTAHKSAITSILISNPPSVKSEHGIGFDGITLMGGASYGRGTIIQHKYYDLYRIPEFNLTTDFRQVSFISEGLLVLTSETDLSAIKNLSHHAEAFKGRGIRSAKGPQ